MKFFYNLIISFCIIFSSNLITAEDRSYIKIVNDNKGKPILKIICEYIGKKPIGEFNYNYNWKERNTDFYNYIRVNLTDKPIEFIKYESYTKLKNGERANIIVCDYKKEPMYDGNILPAYGKKIRKNYFYSSKIPYSIRYYDITIKYDGREYTYTTYDIFKK